MKSESLAKVAEQSQLTELAIRKWNESRPGLPRYSARFENETEVPH